jgi:hypothetical protein
MSKVAPRPTLLRRPQFPSDLRRLFRELARVAVASSFSVAAVACTRYQLDDEPKLEEEPGGQSGQGGGGAGGVGGQAGGPQPPDGGFGGVGGTSGIGGAGGFAGDAGGGGFGGTSGFGGVGGNTPEAPWIAIPCDPGTFTPNLIDPSMLQRPIDFAATYRVWFDQWSDWDSGVPVESSYVTEQVLFGDACGLATDWAACNRALNALKPTPDSCLDGEACRTILTTEGDALMRIEERAALRALLGPIDTAKEAGLAAWLSGTDVACLREGSEPVLGTRTRQTARGIEVETGVEDCYGPSGDGYVRRELVLADGSVEFISQVEVARGCPVAGRRPEGLQAASYEPCDELGAYFASAAHLEAASVHAFARFARELHALGAPEALVADAWRAALEEIAHTRMVGMIAARFGGEVPMPSIAEPAARDAFAIALENAVEGCVRESYGALVAWYQAETATDPMVKSAMAQIAEDETRHAELSWRVAEWLEPQLTESQRARIATARREAFTSLQGELAKQGLSEAAAARIGLPDQDRSLALLTQMSTAFA